MWQYIWYFPLSQTIGWLVGGWLYNCVQVERIVCN